MPSSVGPYQTRGSNLVFNYDVGDVANSYIGEPTTNLANFNIASSGFGSDTSGNLTQTSNSSEATYRGRLSRKMVVGAGYWNAYVFDYNTGVSSAVFAVSYKVKTADGSHPNTIIGGGYIYGSAGSFFPAPTFTYLSDGWYLATMLYAGSSMVLNSLTGMNGSGGPKTFYIIDYQAEAKTHSTPFAGVAGTRSNTQGLLDISGYNNTVTLNTSYDANAMMYFDGTDDYINASTTLGADCTLELVIQSSNYNVKIPISLDGNNYSSGPNIFFYNNVISWNTGDSADNPFSNSSYPNSNYHHIVVSNTSGVNAILYIDGVQIGTARSLNATTTGANKLWIGRFHGDNNYTIAGNIPVVKVYNRVLSTSEITTNYNSYKKRFNLS